jgi:hypothetical protein
VKYFSPTSVQFKSEINGAFLCKRHQKQHLEFLTAFLRTRRLGVRIPPGAPLPDPFFQLLADKASVCFEVMPRAYEREDLTPVFPCIPIWLPPFRSKPFPVVESVYEELPIVPAVAKTEI